MWLFKYIYSSFVIIIYILKYTACRLPVPKCDDPQTFRLLKEFLTSVWNLFVQVTLKHTVLLVLVSRPWQENSSKLWAGGNRRRHSWVLVCPELCLPGEISWVRVFPQRPFSNCVPVLLWNGIGLRTHWKSRSKQVQTKWPQVMLTLDR